MRSRRFEYGSANPAAHLESGICSVDDRVNPHFCNVLPDDGKGHRYTPLLYSI
jgi:hypothetical protein